MASVILAGHRRDFERVLREALLEIAAEHEHWVWDFVAGNSKSQALLEAKQVDAVLELAASKGGSVIIGVSEDSRRDDVAKRISPHFRFRWLDANLLRDLPRKQYDLLLAAIKLILTEESYWVDNIRPTKFASPLMLPEQFRATRELEPVWRLAKSYNNMQNLHTAVRLISRFESEHRRKVDGKDSTPWVDSRGWVWDDSGALHGTPEFPGGWKLSYQIPDGRHFDVTPRGTAAYLDAAGLEHPLPRGKTYWNINAHGLVRGVLRTR